MAKFAVLEEALGLGQPMLPPDILDDAMSRALPVLADDDARTWASSFDFDFTASTSTGVLEADEQGRRVLTDARDCVAAGDQAEVVHFERFTRGDVRGHRCVMSTGGDEAGTVWALYSRTFAEGPNRRLSAFYGVAMSIEGDQATARAMVEARLGENVGLAGVLADYALEMLLAREAGTPDSLTPEDFAERMTRLQQRLADLAAMEAGETAPAPPPAAE